MDDTVLGEVSCSTYLGVLLTTDITWVSHISICAKKANSRLGFIKRNLKGCPQSLKRTAYISLVRSIMEYSSVVWDPHLKKDKDALERVQQCATRWICSSYSQRASVTSMLSALGLESLEQRREIARLTMMYKILNGYVSNPSVLMIWTYPLQIPEQELTISLNLNTSTALQKHFATHLLQEQFQPGTDFLQTLQRPTRGVSSRVGSYLQSSVPPPPSAYYCLRIADY